MKKVILDKNWQLSHARYGVFPATVPGCVHTDLQKNGVISDCFWRDNNEKYQWIENEDWTYSCRFDCEHFNQTATLTFEGLDTYATVALNGEVLGETHNMFIPHSFDVSGKLKQKDNRLEVFFRSPVKEVEGLPKLEAAFTCERLHSRRMQCTYYWDWVDRFVTCGIFLPVYLELGEDFCVDNTYIYTETVDDFAASIRILTEFKNYQKTGVVTFEIVAPNGKVVRSQTQYVAEPQTDLRMHIEHPALWWPSGYGEQPLYTLRIMINGEEYRQSFGIRTLRIVEIPDCKDSKNALLAKAYKALQREVVDKETWDYTEESAGFMVIVNGVRIYCRGANWVPCSPFPSEESEEKIKEILALAKEGNMNMIRVWGGGLFEKDVFYDECDRLGLLVTQDFLMACGAYPEKEEWFLNELKKESAFAAKKLRNHPCLAWWVGDNENATFGTDLQQTYRGRTAALVGLEPQLRAFDPARAFLRSSPYGGTPYMSITRGTTHTTNFFGDMFKAFLDTDCQNYKEHFEHFMGRFITEEPVYGNPQRSTLLRFMTEDDLYDERENILRVHSKTNPCVTPTLYDYGKAFAQKAFGGFADADDRLFKYEYMQFEWIRVVFEHCRRRIGYNDGLLFWMLNDCWPASMSWSIIDFYNLPKAAWYAFKRCAKSVVGSLKKEKGKYVLHLSSDGETGKAKIVCHTDMQTAFFETEIELKPYDVVTVDLPYPSHAAIALCDITVNGRKDRCFYKDGALPLAKTETIRVLAQTENTVTIQATAYLHAVRLEGEYVFSDNYFSMLNGEELTLTYRPIASEKQPKPFTVTAFTLQ
ncbi:MAG: hypothetical protein J6A63_03470 [Clostridia bacterium]|nr:hypothetical protein [Clostridia bacterium]